MTQSEIIDDVLNALNEDRGVSHESMDTESHRRLAYRKLEAYGLVTKSSKLGVYKLSKIGYEVIEAGGFTKWLAAENKKEAESYQATLDTATAAVDSATSARHSKYAAIVAIGIACIPIIIQLYQVGEDNKRDLLTESLSDRVQMLDSLRKAGLENSSAVTSISRPDTVRVQRKPVDKKH